MKPLLAICAALALAGCASDNGSSASAPSSSLNFAQQSTVDRAATIANALRTSSDSPAQVLARHGVTESQFESMLYEISSDPEMSRAYNAKVGL